ncbi:Stk1 family PASTA domain-containing Ser/Thr kinase [Clostridium perfringens]|uniref:Stk1 family PASTA domain-containing Ser/Thr kinase n=1 Tax=Clostridium perfringens TaxID=1502 RepID=UPI001ABB36C4|nr:Stk1 family PASTA domain-containing Ser/Thr kinase [Clostridium perfringens]MBO3321626.1 Stk1 family PASTA domain-containing Ser/Thr kinase [Clostridium perfringens]
MIGKILGNRYELLQCVGEGGMSFVYKARCRKLNRFVAVKILKDEFKNNEEIVRRFKKEATAIANLSNPNVVNVLDVGTQDDINYIVMEYVEGKTLKDIIKEKGALPYEVAISIGIKVAKALECAHKSGIIHRDVKPQNILVTEEGVVKVTDFGIAKSMDSSTIAHTNSVMGSAHYFSPEQAKGTYTDYRTDLYSLGIVLYEMVTGVVPFNGDSPVTVAVKHIQEKAIPPKNINQNIPNSLNDLIMKAMEKDPVNRYQTAKEIIGDLEKIKKDPNVTISSKSAEDEDQFTRVMSPVVVPKTETNNSEPDEDDEDDDDEDEDDDDEENNIQAKPQKSINKKKKKSPILIIIATILVVALGITLGFLGMKKFIEGGKDVKIPNVVGEKVEDAKSKLEGLGLKVVEVTEESDQEKGIVLKVDPNVDSTVKTGSEVKLTVSGGEGQIKVPNFAEMNLDSVKRTLKSLGLELGSVDEEYSDSVPRGEVISQSPNANESVDKGSKVNVTISKGKEIKNITLNIPDVSGKSVDEAKSILANAGVGVNPVKGEAAKSEGEAGKVYSQSQSGPFTIKQGEKVTITINYYGDYVKPEKSVPGVTGKSVDEAKSELTNAGFKVNAVKGEAAKSADQAGKVYSQDGGSSAKEGTTITITYYGEYVEPNPTPNPDPKPNPDQKPDSQTSSTTNQDHKKS